ncbi:MULTISPECIES: type IV conjugative transfer system protein TraE [Sphingomonadaceae]|jgi:conjugal transfer pilus assembly protein TraE|uniref:Conjugal transfer protein TraE n=5 Tax=Sphingomonas TaxID=13687 RepID=A0A7Y2KLW4_SPHPI|nr:MULTISPECIES: type IV conjugative transfer system protein TraE [Sphingomonadaceae]MBQ8107087.1 type IV conjugative transfer system protein TraE [Afipia sp.]MBI0533318.1 conjugal transfer protein TraE [Sphingomonas sp. TX0522]MBM7408045.1 conjugal transfer pilus assembly protein TraE [Sphingomonas sp. JUb134]MBP8234063.1 type IV conjugative transfer system protein TraE [Rhizorhabdus sp.]MBS86456.1 conjugal transfer protein TraE [Sphingobium sp.]|tara:strand:+ start:352 stop:939 length:588 start_codon:yes stop_codon:yes gene_type:complete
MDYSVGLAQSQRVLKQRNMLGIVALVLAGLVVLLFLVGATRDREIVLQPIVRSPLTLSSSGVSEQYLEMVTRDTALMTLNRSPENLEYWMDSILAIATPEAHGSLKRDLMKILNEQRGSSISQYFTLAGMKVDTEKLTSEVTGTLHTVVGSKSVTAEPKTFRFYWAYRGLTLQLKGFGMVTKADKDAAATIGDDA